MNFSGAFFTNSLLLGVGLAMDAFSVSLANGLNETKMKWGRIFKIAGVFSFFQAAMPMIGWICVHTILQHFTVFEKLIPWIALILLGGIGAKMLLDALKPGKDETEKPAIGFTALMVQGVATSIDALSVGFTIAEYNWFMAVVCALLIAVVTFFICVGGILIGKRFGTRLASKASVLGGVILIMIGIEIFINGVF